MVKKVCILAISLALVFSYSSTLFSEESRLSEDQVPSLKRNNYRDKINMAEKCIVLYFRTDVSGTVYNDAVMEELIKNLPSKIKFYKVDLTSFDKAELKFIMENDIGRNILPSIVPYVNGFPLDTKKVRGPAKKEWIEDILNAYMTGFY